jgi:hypothetical protein
MSVMAEQVLVGRGRDGSGVALAASFARARAEDVPALAPAAYAQAIATWRRRDEQVADETSRQALDQEVSDELAEAVRIARRSREVIGDLVRRRTEILRGEPERRLAPKRVMAADEAYHAAVGAAERGELEAAALSAESALELFRAATVESIEQGPVRRLEQLAAEAGAILGGDARAALQAEVAALRTEAAEAGQSDLAVASFRERTTLARRRIGSTVGDLFDLDGIIRDPDPFPGDLGVRGKPDPVRQIDVTARGTHELSLLWRDGSSRDESNVLLRQEEGGPWQPVATFGELTGLTSQTDVGLQADTLYCYRVQSENEAGSVVTPMDSRACGYTRGEARLPVRRVQLRVRTADVSDAGTDNPVLVRLTSPLASYSPHGNQTWLDYGPRWTSEGWRDDFARGRDFTYDLDTSHISDLSDITMLTILKEGTDAVAIAELALIVNDVEVFHRSFGESAATCLWIDEDPGYSPAYTITKAELRAHPLWQAYVASPPAPSFVIPNAEIVSRLEAMIGNLLHGQDVGWGEFHSPAWVEATYKDAERLSIDLDLEASVAVLADPEVDLNFDLRFSIMCDSAGQPTLHIVSENVDANVSFGFLTTLLGSLLVTPLGVWAIEEIIAKRIEDGLQPVAKEIGLPTAGSCPTVRVGQNGDVLFST